mgnify:CR=1 FL=1
MNLRKIKKQFKQDVSFLWSEHDQIAFMKRSSKLYIHGSSKFPHYKWARISYHENPTLRWYKWAGVIERT